MLNKDFNIYKSYIYTRRKIFISYIGTVFFICLPVYSAFLKPDPLLYGIFLSFVFMVFFIVYDYLKYKKDCNLIYNPFYLPFILFTFIFYLLSFYPSLIFYYLINDLFEVL